VNDLVQFVLDCMEDIRRCVHQMALPEEQSLTIDAMIEEVCEHILLYAREKGLL
jgi:hypothetical protein